MRKQHLFCARFSRSTEITSLLAGSLVFLAGPVFAASVTMSPMLTFGGGDGWLAPLETGFFTNIPSLSDGVAANATERSIAYSADANHLYLPTRQGGTNVLVMDANTGVQVSSLNMTGVGGGFFAINAVSGSASGHIYVSNLTLAADGRNYAVYRWEDETSLPTVALNTPSLNASRMGDTLDLIGDNLTTQLVAGNGAPGNGYATLSTLDGVNFSETQVSITGPAAADFSTGITFLDSDSVIGSKGTGGFRFTDFAGATGTLVQSKVLTNTSERPMDFATVNGVPLLATLETNGNNASPPASFSMVRIYDLTDFANPVLVASSRAASSYFPQGVSAPGAGSVTWGAINGNTATLYALSVNNGIQAFNLVVVPEPGIAALLACGALLLARRRRR